VAVFVRLATELGTSSSISMTAAESGDRLGVEDFQPGEKLKPH
jgi:hypothetical protein